MRPSSRLKHLSLHAWAGILSGLAIFALTLSGTVAVFHHELEQWQEPVARQSHLAAEPAYTLDAVFEEQMARADGRVESFAVTLPRPNQPWMEVTLRLRDEAGDGEARYEGTVFTVTPDGGLAELGEPPPGVAGLLLQLHTRLHLPLAVAPWVTEVENELAGEDLYCPL